MKTSTPDLQVEYRPITSLRPAKRNPRTHSSKHIRQLVESLQTFGFINPILLDADERVLAGHGRLAAAKALNLDQVPTIRLAHLTEAQRRAYVLADNKLAELAGWDHELLALELQELSVLEMDFDLTVTGFETAEIDLALDSLMLAKEDPSTDTLPPLDATGPPVSQLGDCWQCGAHRLLCGDAREPAAYEVLCADTLAEMVFVDPPYNVPIVGHAGGLGAVQHPNFTMASGEMSEEEFITFLRTIFSGVQTVSRDGALHFICMDWRHLYELLTAARREYAAILNLCVWNKSNGGMGSLYRSKHELILVAKQGAALHINNIVLGQHGRYRTNVWDYPGVNTFQPGRADLLALHPTVKPVALIADAIQDCTRRNGVVLDPCAGSGTTLLAAEQTGRRALAMDVDPHYVDVAIQRWQQATGQLAIHMDTGRTWTQVQENRLVPQPPESGPRRSPSRRPAHG